MTGTNPTTVNPREILATLRRHLLLWSVPAVVTTAAALAFAMVHSDTWKASQALLVRDEASGSLSRQGRFDNAEAMKTAQETILETAKSRAVTSAALTAVGPPPQPQPASTPWPSDDDLADLERAIEVTAPKGAEFGSTEVIYLSVTAETRERAVALAAEVTGQLDRHLRQLRNRKAESIVAELEKTVRLAKTDLDAATKRLQSLEIEVGSDLGELRVLNEVGAGDSNLRGALKDIKNELRQAGNAHNANVELRKLLVEAQQDPQRLVDTPNRLLESQPAVRRLKEGLVDAQLRTAQLLGKMSQDHPEVKAAVAAEAEVRGHLIAELEIAVRGLAADLKVSGALIQSLETQSADVEQRLDRLAGLRARYGNLVAETRQASETFEKAQKDLADARASQAAAETSSLIARLDVPQTGNRPVGPSRSLIVITGAAGGLMAGLGLVFLRAPLSQLKNRRWSDRLGFGRRAEDQEAKAAQGTGERRRGADRRGDSDAGRTAD